MPKVLELPCLAVANSRREQQIPAVVYGHGNDPIHLTLPGHETMMALKHGGANALLERTRDRPAVALSSHDPVTE